MDIYLNGLYWVDGMKYTHSELYFGQWVVPIWLWLTLIPKLIILMRNFRIWLLSLVKATMLLRSIKSLGIKAYSQSKNGMELKCDVSLSIVIFFFFYVFFSPSLASLTLRSINLAQGDLISWMFCWWPLWPQQACSLTKPKEDRLHWKGWRCSMVSPLLMTRWLMFQ